MSVAPAELPALPESFAHRLHALQKLADRVGQQACVARTGLPLGEARCLAAIGNAGAPLSVNELARGVHLDKGQASRAAQSLVDQGLVRKGASPQDARGVVLTLTAAGRRRWQRVMAVLAQRDESMLAVLGPRERVQLGRLLDRVVEQARAMAGHDADA